MKFTLVPLALIVASTEAFAPVAQNTFEQTSALQATRKDFLNAAVLSTSAAVASLVANPGAANAAKYGFVGRSPSGVVDSKDAIVDEERLKSAEVQKSVNNVKGYLDLINQMDAALAKNSQVDLGPAIRKNLDFQNLRDDMNRINSAFDEETQRGTDRLIRVVLQDVTELETANRQKEGIPRSERRVETMQAKLKKLGGAFTDLLKFTV